MTSEQQASQTAMTAAAARAAHLIVDSPPVIFADTLAMQLLGEQAEDYVGYHRAHGAHVVLSGARGQVTCRSRYTEERLAESIGRGIGQYVILGAGLDSFAYRSPLADQVRVFEVDHRATQERKRALLSAAGIALPDNLSLVPVDFEADSLEQCLALAGFDRGRPAFVSWLGVTMYLTRPAIGQTLAELGRLAPGTELVADYMLPAGLRDEAGTAYADQFMPVAAERGEPWLSFFSPQDLSALLADHGFGPARHIAQRDIGGEAMWSRTDSLRPVQLSLLAHAAVRPAG